jgi:hypothetical protein
MNTYYLEKMMEDNQKELSKVSTEAWKRNALKERTSVFYTAYKKIVSLLLRKKSLNQCKPVCCS